MSRRRIAGAAAIALAAIVLLSRPGGADPGVPVVSAALLALAVILAGAPAGVVLLGFGVVSALIAHPDPGVASALLRVAELVADQARAVLGSGVLVAVALYLVLAVLLERLSDPASPLTGGLGRRRQGPVGAAAHGLAVLLPPSALPLVLAAAAGVPLAQLYAGLVLPLTALALAWGACLLLLARGGRAGARPAGAGLAPAVTGEARPHRPAVLALLRTAAVADDALARGQARRALSAAALPAILFAALMTAVWHLATLPISPAAAVAARAVDGSDESPAEWIDPLPPLREPPGSAPLPAGEAPAAVPPAAASAVPRAAGGAAVGGSDPARPWMPLAAPAVPLPDEDPDNVPPPHPLGVQEPPGAEPDTVPPPAPAPGIGLAEPQVAAQGAAQQPDPATEPIVQPIQEPPGAQAAHRPGAPLWFRVCAAAGTILLVLFYLRLSPPALERLERVSRGLAVRLLPGLGLPAVLVFGLGSTIGTATALALGLLALAARRGRIDRRGLSGPAVHILRATLALFCLLLGAALFGSVFVQLGGDDVVESALLRLDATGALFVVLVLFLAIVLGVLLRRTEAVLFVVPLLFPMLPRFDVDPLHLALLFALCLQAAALIAALRLSRRAPLPAPTPTPHGESAGGAGGGGVLLLLVLQLMVLLALLLAPGFGLWLPRLLFA